MSPPLNNKTPNEQVTSVIALPDKWIVANNGTQKSATLSRIVVFLTDANVTGIVADEDCVPIAVK